MIYSKKLHTLVLKDYIINRVIIYKGGILANHKSAVKRHKQSKKREAINKSTKTRIKNVVRGLRESISAGDKNAAQEQLPLVASVLAKAAKRTIHWKKAARKTSRLMKAVNAMNA